MNEFLTYIRKIIRLVSFYLSKLYNKCLFLFNKQMTLKKIYDPLVENKQKQNSELANNLANLQKENKDISTRINKLRKDNIVLKARIKLIKELLVKK